MGSLVTAETEGPRDSAARSAMPERSTAHRAASAGACSPLVRQGQAGTKTRDRAPRSAAGQAGETTYHLYSVPGVIPKPYLATYFACTSADTASIRVGVEVFGSAGGDAINDVVAYSVVVGPGATVTFGTVSAGWGFTNDVGCGTGIISASARILGTSKKLVCTAFLAEPYNVPPASMAQLTIIAKTKQKAAN